MLVLSFNFGHDGSATLVEDGKILRHIASERITGRKKERGVNKEVIEYVLDGICKVENIDAFSIVNYFFDTDSNGRQLFQTDDIVLVNRNGQFFQQQDWANFINSNAAVEYVGNASVQDVTKPCFLVDHHFAHSAYSYFTSPFNEALTLSVDVNDTVGRNNSIHYFNGSTYNLLHKGGNFTIGGLYSQICDYLGFYPSLTDAGKVMALAAYGAQPNEELIEHDIYDMTYDQYISFLSKFPINKIPNIRSYYPQLKHDVEAGKVDDHWLSKDHWKEALNCNIASGIQYQLECSMARYVDRILNMYRMTDNICFSGGTFLNCVMNGILEREFEDYNIWISPAAGDDGLSIGAGLYISQNIEVNGNQLIVTSKDRVTLKTSEVMYGGKEYVEEIYKEIENSKYEPEEYDVKVIAKDLKAGKIVSWFDGGSEMGPRALCHRSILANPCLPDMKDILNKRVKKREEFRPFAPVVLREDAHEWFSFTDELSKEFMLFSVKCNFPSEIPSAIHIDNSARIQIVDESISPKICKLLSEFKKLSKVPILINTSFNVQGQPIVETPKQAIDTFDKEDIDILVIGDYVLRKADK